MRGAHQGPTRGATAARWIPQALTSDDDREKLQERVANACDEPCVVVDKVL